MSRTDRAAGEGLPRFIGPLEGALFCVTVTVGTAIFLVPGTVALNAGFASSSTLLFTRLFVLALYPMVAVAILGVVRLRARDGLPKGYAMPWYPWPVLVYVLGIAAICCEVLARLRSWACGDVLVPG